MIGRSFNILDNYKMFLTVDLIIISILIYKFYLQYSVSLVTDCNEMFSCNKNLIQIESKQSRIFSLIKLKTTSR